MAWDGDITENKEHTTIQHTTYNAGECLLSPAAGLQWSVEELQSERGAVCLGWGGDLLSAATGGGGGGGFNE